jgi:ComF family protein
MDRPRRSLRGSIRRAVFSSTEDIRASQATFADAGRPIVSGRSFPKSEFWFRRACRRSLESLFSVLFPSDCRICHLPLLNISRLPVCLECLASIHPIAGHVCSICGERVLSSYAQPDDDGLTRCPVCRRIEYPFERAVAYGSYDGALRELIHLLKFDGVLPAANMVATMLAQPLISLLPEFNQQTVLVIPVPLFKGKRRQRGFNQAELVARIALKQCAGRERFELATDTLLRIRETRSQIGLTSNQRRENLRGAFAVLRATEVTGREIVLVDDVYTTGTTASECSRVLRRAGAAKVWVVTTARTLKLASKELEVDGLENSKAGSNVSEFQGFAAVS